MKRQRLVLVMLLVAAGDDFHRSGSHGAENLDHLLASRGACAPRSRLPGCSGSLHEAVSEHHRQARGRDVGRCLVKSLSALEAGTLPAFQFAIPDSPSPCTMPGRWLPSRIWSKRSTTNTRSSPTRRTCTFMRGSTGTADHHMVMLMTYRRASWRSSWGSRRLPKPGGDAGVRQEDHGSLGR